MYFMMDQEYPFWIMKKLISIYAIYWPSLNWVLFYRWQGNLEQNTRSDLAYLCWSSLAPCFPPSASVRYGWSPNPAAFSMWNFGWHKSRPINPPCGWHRLCAQPRLCERQKRRQLLSDMIQRVSLIHRPAPAPSPWPTASNGCKWAIECILKCHFAVKCKCLTFRHQHWLLKCLAPGDFSPPFF